MITGDAGMIGQFASIRPAERDIEYAIANHPVALVRVAIRIRHGGDADGFFNSHAGWIDDLDRGAVAQRDIRLGIGEENDGFGGAFRTRAQFPDRGAFHGIELDDPVRALIDNVHVPAILGKLAGAA